MFRSELPIRLLLALSSTAELPGKLVALQAISNDALKADALPTRLKLLNWGDNETLKGNVHVGPATVLSLAAKQAEFGFDRIALDYNHNSLPGHANFKADPREVAAYGVPQIVAGDGLYLDQLEYTPSGKSHAREYCDLSPTPLLDAKGEVIFLHSVALCPQGAVKGLSFFSASFLQNKPASMDYKKLLLTLLSLTVSSLTKSLPGLKLVALSAEASDKEIEDACNSFADQIGKLKPTEKQEGTPELSAFTALLKAQGDQLTALNAKFELQERDAITAGALRDGKIIPLSAKDLSIDQFRKLVGELPADQVPLDRRTPEEVQAFSAGLGSRNSADEAVRTRLGLSKETWNKHAA